MDTLTIVRLWAAAAWADGFLHPAEEAALRRLIEASTELGEPERQHAMGLLTGPPGVKVEEVQKLDATSREGVYRAVLGIIRLDGKVTGEEQEWVARLRDRLGLDAAVLARIEGEQR